jgi:Putative beta barrel porin-7 (BBP7)
MSMNRSPLIAAFAVLSVVSLAPGQTPSSAPVTLAPPVASPNLTPSDAGVPFDAAPAGDQGDRAWVNAEYLLWWMRGQSLPALATTSPTGTSATQAGVLGAPGTSVLFGDALANNTARSGGRISAGTWIGDGQIFGVEGDFFMLETKAANFGISSGGSPILGRPFIDANTDLPVALRVAYPGEFSGDIAAEASTTGLTGAGLLLRANLLCSNDWRLDMLGGYRFLRFADRLTVSDDQTALPGNPDFLAPGTRISTGDEFATKNLFNGFEFGLSGSYQSGPFSVVLLSKLAVGYNQQDVDIFGATYVSVPGTPSTNSTGGLLALPSNIGHFSRNSEISVIPEIELKVGYQLTPRLRATLGYTFLYWDNVVRAADQVDRMVNPNLLPNSGATGGPLAPAFQFNRDNLWVQGLEVGLEFRF